MAVDREVPDMSVYVLPRYVELTDTPGADTKTFPVPWLENDASVSEEVVAETPIAPGQAAG
jgi:hypothetical protein